MKIYLKFIPIFLLLIGCVANQEVQENINNNNNPSQANAEANKDNKICRQVSVSGSRLKKKVCYTSEEEEAMAEKSQRILREQQNRERVRSGMPDPG
jgi:hypothetical protein|tara:strand:+ start:315 stop:605 length:291 start_codon:yes stop_codon:yes gene_type:complete